MRPTQGIDPCASQPLSGAVGDMDDAAEVTCDCGGSHTSNLSQEEAREIARAIFATRQEYAAKLAAEAKPAKAKRRKAAR